jgi:hypothetical protein
VEASTSNGNAKVETLVPSLDTATPDHQML